MGNETWSEYLSKSTGFSLDKGVLRNTKFGRFMKKRKILLGVLLLLIPGLFCAGKKEKTEMTVLIRMMDIQDLWFREKMTEFEKQNQVKLNVVTFDQIEDVKGMIQLEMKTGEKKIGLVKTAREMIYPLAKENLMIPLREIVDSVRLAEDLSEYLPLAVDGGEIDGKTYYIPRKLETYLLLFLI